MFLFIIKSNCERYKKTLRRSIDLVAVEQNIYALITYSSKSGGILIYLRGCLRRQLLEIEHQVDVGIICVRYYAMQS